MTRPPRITEVPGTQSRPSRARTLLHVFRQHQALAGGEAVLGEEVEEAEIVPGDLGAHGLDVKRGEVGQQLGHQRVADARPGVAGIDADGVDGRRSDCAPNRVNIRIVSTPERRLRTWSRRSGGTR